LEISAYADLFDVGPLTPRRPSVFGSSPVRRARKKDFLAVSPISPPKNSLKRSSTLLGFLRLVRMKTTSPFSRRGPDRVVEELATVLSSKASFEFKALFSVVHANLKLRNAASGGEEMLRLRTYEKLQNLVQAGLVKKGGKEYCGVPAGLAAFMESAAVSNADFEARKAERLAVNPK
jgi:hypothetical protein